MSAKIVNFGDLEKFQGYYGIDLNEEKIATSGTNQSKSPLSLKEASSLTEITDAPIKLTFAEGFEFMLQKISSIIHRQSNDSKMSDHRKKICVFQGADVDSVYIALTNIKHITEYTDLNLSSKGYVSWFDVICRSLKDVGIIRDLQYISGRHMILV